MHSSPLLFTLYSAAPIGVQLRQPLSCAALDLNALDVNAMGVNTLCELHQQRLSAYGEKELDLLQKQLALAPQQAELWGCALYPQLPLEAAEIQPFSRPQRGAPCQFLMSAELQGLDDSERFPIGDQWPVSCTDQERAFCLLQERMRKLWSEGRPDQEMRLALVADYAGRLNRLGSHNFIHWDGEMLFAYACADAGQEPLAFLEVNTAQGEQALPLISLHSDDAVAAVCVANASLLPAEATVIPPGAVVCFRNGAFSELCEQVSFWS